MNGRRLYRMSDYALHTLARRYVRYDKQAGRQKTVAVPDE